MSNVSLYWFQKEAMRRIEESWGKGNKSVLISVPTGGGKCVSGDTLIYTNSGICEIGKLAVGVPSGTAVYRRGLSVDARAGERECSHVYHSSVSSVIQIKTKLGYELSGTPEHPVLVREKDGQLVMKRLHEVAIGESAVLKKGCDLWVPFPPGKSKGSLGAALNMSYLLGELGKDIQKLSDILCGCKSVDEVVTRHNAAHMFIEKIDEVPSVILNGGKEIIEIFLRSLFSREQPSDDISFWTHHEKLAKQVQVLLLALGIPSKREQKTNGGVLYSVTVEVPYIGLFVKLIGFTDRAWSRRFGKLTKTFSDKDLNIYDEDSRFLFDPVARKDYGVSEVYDLTVPDGHEFVGNGFIAHNTIIFSSILKNTLDADKGRKGRGLILVHRDTLLTQAQDKLNFVWPGVTTGRVQGGSYDYDKQVTIASVPTLSGRLDEFKTMCEQHGAPEIVVYDEAHHACASSWKKITQFLKENYNPLMLGVTATPMRTNKRESLAEIFEDVPYSISIFQLIQEGFLSPLVGYSIETDLNLSGVGIQHGDFNAKELSNRIRRSNFDRTVAQAWKEKGGSRKAICFAVDIDHVESLVEEFKKIGAKVAGIHGKMARDEQRKILTKFEKGKYQVLVNCMILTEGFDEPSIDCVLMARPTSSRILFVQMVGRGLRLFPGKKDCLLMDFAGNADGNSMITMQDLLGFYGLNKAEKLYKDRLAGKPFVASPDTIGSMMSLDKFGEELETSLASRDIDVFDINRFAWGAVGGSQFVTVRKNVSIAIYESDRKSEDSRKKYIPYLVYANKQEKWFSPLSESVDKEFAMAIANVQLFDYGDRNLASKDAPWRSENCTPQQAQTLRTALERYNRESHGQHISLSEIPQTRGDYSSMITSLFTLGYIKSGIKQVARDEALEMLKERVIKEISDTSVNGTDSSTERNQDSDIGSSLRMTGDITDGERRSFMEVLMALQSIKYGDFPLKFLVSNPIEFKNNKVLVRREKYPPYPLSEKQKAFLTDKISLVFRLHFRNKGIEIVDTSKRGG